ERRSPVRRILQHKAVFCKLALSVSLVMLLVTATDITVWIISALLALGIGWGKYAKWKARNQLVRELAAMDRDRREKVLSRMNPELAMEARQELMRRFNIFCMWRAPLYGNRIGCQPGQAKVPALQSCFSAYNLSF